MMRKFIAHNLEKHHRESPEEFCVVLFDLHGSSTSNMVLSQHTLLLLCLDLESGHVKLLLLLPEH